MTPPVPRIPGGLQPVAGAGDAAEAAEANLKELAADQVERLIEADRPTVDKLIGAGQKFEAETCLFVSWSGFKPNVQKELAASFFKVRLWSRKDLLEKLYDNYERLPEEIRLKLPLKRMWMVTADQQE